MKMNIRLVWLNITICKQILNRQFHVAFYENKHFGVRNKYNGVYSQVLMLGLDWVEERDDEEIIKRK